MSLAKKYRYSEVFGGNDGPTPTIQGEGKYAGHPTVWIRFWGCNFNCDGFGQKDPRDPSTYELHYKDYDPAAAGIKSTDTWHIRAQQKRSVQIFVQDCRAIALSILVASRMCIWHSLAASQ